MKTAFVIPAALAAALLTSTAPTAVADVAACGRTLFTPPGSDVLTGNWHRSGGQQLCAGLVIHGDDTAAYVFGDGNLTHPTGGTVSDNGKTYSFVDGEGSTYTFHSDGSASFNGGSGKMVGQFKVDHMPRAAVDPKPDAGFSGSTNPSVEHNVPSPDSVEKQPKLNDEQPLSGAPAQPGKPITRPEVAVAPLNAADFRVRNLSLGMSIDAIKEKIGPGFSDKDIVGKDTPINLYVLYNQNEIYVVITLETKAIDIQYYTMYATGSEPNLGDLTTALSEKYGKINFHSRMLLQDSSDRTFSWVYDKDDRLMPHSDKIGLTDGGSTNALFCSTLEGFVAIIGPKALNSWNDAIFVPSSWRRECGKSVWATIKPTTDPKIAAAYSVMLWDERPGADFRLKKANDAAQAAKANKPQL